MNKTKSLLIFDDDELIGQTITNIAKFCSMDVRYTSSYSEFLAILSSWQPSHIILDLVMPGSDGIEVLAELSKLKVRTHIIVTSGVSIRVLEAAGRSAAARGLNIIGILPKPFTHKQFRVIIDQKPSVQSDSFESLNKPISTVDFTSLADRLNDTLTNNTLDFALQPKLDCRTSQLKGFEVLARWTDSELGWVNPETFINAAEKTGLINLLTQQICAKSFAWFSEFILQMKSEMAENADNLTLSFNISASSLLDKSTIDYIEQLCDLHQIPAHNIIFELTETAAMDDPIQTLDVLTQLRMKGFNLSIDDFGTGFSSMLQLVRLPFSELKIDKSFVLTAQESRESKIVIKATIELAQSLGLQVTAEGVEDIETFNYLKQLGCNQMQGFLFSKPLPSNQILHWVNSNRQSKEQRRIANLNAYNVMDSPAEFRFDRLTRLATRLFKVSTSVVSFLDGDRQWFKAKTGTSLVETSRSIAFCDHTIRSKQTMVVTDALLDERFADNPLVMQSPFIRFYAGHPIFSPEGEVLGAFCIMDSQPREFSEQETIMLAELAAMVEAEIVISSQLAEDFLTGLLNRKTFEQRATTLIDFCIHENLTLSMIYLDLDDFKRINDEHGHQVGDEVLKYFALTMQSIFRESDLIARLGGDEYVVMMVDSSEETTREALARLKMALSKANSQTDNLPIIEFSAGLAITSRQKTLSLQELYHMADIDMYKAKNQKKIKKS